MKHTFKVGDKVRFTKNTPKTFWFGPHTDYRGGRVSQVFPDGIVNVEVTGARTHFTGGTAYGVQGMIEMVKDVAAEAPEAPEAPKVRKKDDHTVVVVKVPLGMKIAKIELIPA
jgi:hypothetical protein